MEKVKLCISIDADLIERVDAVKKRFSRSAMLNEAIDRGLKDIESGITG